MYVQLVMGEQVLQKKVVVGLHKLVVGHVQCKLVYSERWDGKRHMSAIEGREETL